MKTSKRLLSFFLAVVMVITTCSVGFAAFAAEPEDEVFTYVDDEGKAVTLTYDGLNKLVDTYAPVLIEALRSTLEGAGVNVDAVLASENPIGELLAQLSPMLMGLLGTSSDMQTILGSDYNAFSEEKYSYLDDPDATIDFWNLYTICKDNKDAGGAIGEFCSSTFEKLEVLLNAYDSTYESITSQVDTIMSTVLGSKGFGIGFPSAGSTNIMVFYYDDTEEFQTIYNAWTALGTAGVPASHENIGAVPLADGSATLKEFTDSVQANGNIYDNGTTQTDDDYDFTPFINYVSYYAQRNCIISEGETLSLLDAIYYYYNQALTTDRSQIAGAMIASMPEGTSFTFEQDASMMGISDSYSVTFESGKYWYDSAYDQETGFSFDLFTKSIINPFMRITDSEFIENNRGIFNGIYETLKFNGLDVFSTGPYPADSTDSGKEWYYSTVEQILVEMGFFADFNEAEETRLACVMDDEEFSQLKEIAAKYNYSSSSENLAKIKEDIKNSTEITNEVVKYYADLYIDNSSVPQLRYWQPGTEVTSSSYAALYKYKAKVDNDFAYYYLYQYIEGAPSIVNNNYLQFANQLLDINATTPSITERYDYDNYAIPSNVSIDLVNNLLNGYINQYLDPDADDLVPGVIGNINSMLQNLLTTEVPLADVLTDVYKNLAEDPIRTLFNLIPTLVVLIDEVVVPAAFNEEGDAFNGILNLLIPLLFKDQSQDAGSATGIGQLGWDLNEVLPTLLHWLLGDNDYTYTYYNRTDNGDGTFTYGATETGAYGTKYDDEGNATDRVPVILNIYLVDEAIANAAISDLGKADENEDPQTQKAICELVTELATFGTEAVEAYVAEHGEDVKSYNKSGVSTNKGLNNLLVSIPSLINDIGQKFLAKYEVDSDWAFGEFAVDEESGCRYNVSVQQFKDLATQTDPSEEVLKTFVDMFVNNWINALTDILNDLVSDANNKITSEIPIVTSLLNALDLFGETSVLTDALNGFFLMTRENADSFTFETQENGYVGLDTLNAYFLLINLNQIITIIMNIVDANQGGSDDGTTEEPDEGFNINISELTKTITNSLVNNLPTIAENKENKDGAAGLIDALDSLLSALLSNTYMNGYCLDEIDNIYSGIISLVTNMFGEDKTEDVINLINEYLKVMNADVEGANISGTVDPNEVYTKENLSNIVTQTYALIEGLINDNLVIAGDNNKVITSAVNGIISPSAVAVRSDAIDKGISEHFSWTELAATGYAKDLGYDNLKDGDKETFFRDFVDSLGVIPSILGVLLVQGGIYDNTLSPVFDVVCDALGVDYTNKLPANATGKDAVYIVIDTLSNIISKALGSFDSFLDAPVSGLLGLLRGVVGIAQDSFLSSVIEDTLKPIYSELEGLKTIVANISPTLPDVVDSKLINPFKDIIDKYVPSSNTLMSIIGAIAGKDLSGIPLNDVLQYFAKYSSSNEEFLLALYTVLVDIITDDSILGQLMGSKLPWLKDLITSYDSVTLLELLKDIVSSIQNPKELEWMYNEYKKEANDFEYPTGITAQDAEDAIDSLDELVANIFPLLKEFDVIDQDSLSELLNGLIFTNENLTKLAKAVYGGIEEKSNNDADGIFVFSPSQLADYLMDSSYGATFSSAASTLRKCSSWSQVGTINWGFTDGSAKAQEGFVKAFAALARPANDVLAAFLAEGDANLAAIAAQVLRDFDVEVQLNANVKLVLNNSILTIYVNNTDNPGSKTSTIQIDLVPVIEELSVLTIKGGNGYESAIMPLLDAFNVECKNYDEYLKDYKAAKDNLLINILNPIVDFLNDVTAAPFDTLTAALPKLAAFLDNNGLGKAVSNLLAPITDLINVLNKNGINADDLVEQIAGKSLKDLLEGLIGIDLGDLNLELTNLSESLNIQDILIPLVNSILKDKGINIKLSDIDWGGLASLDNQGQVLVSVLRYIEDVLIKNSAAINKLISGIDAIQNSKSKDVILNILDTVFGQIATAKKDDVVLAVFYLLLSEPTNVFFDYSGFVYKDYEFTYPTTVDMDFLTILGPMLDGLIGGLIEGGLSGLVTQNVYTDSIISTIATGLYGAVEGVKINDSMNLTELLAMTGIDFSTDNVADLLENKDYGQSYSSAAHVIRNAGSWSRVKADSLSWGVTDRDSFVHALCAVLRPIYGVLDVLLNDGSLGLFNLIYLPGSDGYTSTIVPLLEAFGCYNVKTQYQYRQDMSKEYDYILIDILNPLLDKVEDLLNAPIQTLADMLPNLALFFANDGLLQIIENLLTPIRALLDAVQPIADVNEILVAAGLNIESELRKLGLVGSDYKFDIYDLSASLRPLIGKDNIVSLLNTVLGMIKIGGSPLGIELMPIDWYQLASHGEVITDEASQASTIGKRIYVDADPNEVLIAVLRYLVETINYKDNYSIISNLIGGLIGGADDSISSVVDNVLGILTGETDEVISELCGVLETLA